MSLATRVRLLTHRPTVENHDEATAARRLGYVLRSDHPWTLNKTRPTAATVSGRVNELESFGVPDSTG